MAEKKGKPKGPKPRVGQEIYVRTSLYCDHGEDDFHGGLCEIAHVESGISGGEPAWFVGVKERPGTRYNYEFLVQEQDELKKRFGTQRGYEDPEPTMWTGDRERHRLRNIIRHAISKAPENVREMIRERGMDTHVFEDVEGLLRAKDLHPLLIGLHEELDKMIGGSLMGGDADL
jgi:hypothetical protein